MAGKRDPISDDMAEIGQNIRKFRKGADLSLNDLAGILKKNYSAKMLSQYENGYINISSGVIIDIASELNVTPNQLYPAWLLGDCQDNTDTASVPADNSTQDDAFALFRRLNNGNQDAVIGLMKTLLKNQN